MHRGVRAEVLDVEPFLERDNETMTQPDSTGSLREGIKLYFETMKHIATLASGTILVAVALVKEHILSGFSRSMLYAIILLIISIFFSVISMFVYAGIVQGNGEVETWRIRLGQLSWWVTCLTFMIALILIVAWALADASIPKPQTQPIRVPQTANPSPPPPPPHQP